MTYGTKLRQYREKARLSQQEVAENLGVGQSTYSQWESDKTTFKVEYLNKLANLFGVAATDLIPEGTAVKIANNVSQNFDNSVVGFEINMNSKDIYKDLLESKDEIIRLLKKQLGDI
jgi:transcriptional regulator with XRE-family HTH domain